MLTSHFINLQSRDDYIPKKGNKIAMGLRMSKILCSFLGKLERCGVTTWELLATSFPYKCPNMVQDLPGSSWPMEEDNSVGARSLPYEIAFSDLP